MSEHAQLCDLIAGLIAEQRRTTEAVTALAEVLAGTSTKTVEAAKATTDKAIEKAKATTEYAEQKAIPTEPADPAPAADAGLFETPAATDYATAAQKVTGLAASKGREAAVAVLAKFGAKTLKEVPADKFAEVVAACDEALA